MIDYDEEIKRFKPSKEIGSVGDAIEKNDITDMQDIVMELIRGMAAAGESRDAAQQ